MSLSKRIAEYKPQRVGAMCKTCELMERLPKSERDALQGAMDDPKFSNAGIAKIMRAEGYHIADSTVRRHRRGECRPA